MKYKMPESDFLTGRLDGVMKEVAEVREMVAGSGFSCRIAIEQIITLFGGKMVATREERKKLPEDNDWWVSDLSNIRR